MRCIIRGRLVPTLTASGWPVCLLSVALWSLFQDNHRLLHKLLGFVWTLRLPSFSSFTLGQILSHVVGFHYSYNWLFVLLCPALFMKVTFCCCSYKVDFPEPEAVLNFSSGETCHSSKVAGVKNNKLNWSWIPFSCSSLRILVMCVASHWKKADLTRWYMKILCLFSAFMLVLKVFCSHIDTSAHSSKSGFSVLHNRTLICFMYWELNQ